MAGAGGGNAHGRHFLPEGTVVAFSVSLLSLGVKTLDPLGSGGGGTLGVVSFLKMPSSSALFVSLTVAAWTPSGDCL
jgi:hypothetical protein